VLLPELSRRLQAGDSAGRREAFNRGTEFALLLTLPAAVALVVIALPITRSPVSARRLFDAEDTAATALALAIYGLGLPAFVLQKALQPLYYAREDTRSPFRFALWSMVVNAALAFGLMPWIGFSAAAMGHHAFRPGSWWCNCGGVPAAWARKPASTPASCRASGGSARLRP
jgi:putative peptidoglycan lipid II flippase